jgi:cell division protease FtsH
MSDELGPILFGSEHNEVFLGKDFPSSRNYSEAIAAKIDKEIYDLITEAYNTAERILKENMDKLHFVAEYLAKNEIMDGEQFERAFQLDASFEALDEIKSRKEAKSRKENEEKAEEDAKKEADAKVESNDDANAEAGDEKTASESETPQEASTENTENN